MSDLSRFFQKQKTICTAEYDQKAMLAREMIYENFDEHDGEKLLAIINHFSESEKVTIALMGVLAQVGLAAMAMEDFTTD